MLEKKIGILGGSFNPPHLGHVAMASFVLKRGEVDQVWLVPCFEHPFDKPLVSFEHRWEMSRLAFQSLGDQIQILDLEKKLGGKSYTFRTVQCLKKEYSHHRFFLIVGEDVAQEAKGWRHYEKLKTIIEWVVLPRGAKSPIPDINATDIREGLKAKKKLESWLDKNVIEYIKRHRLYE